MLYLSLRQLEYIRAVHQTGSLTEAARLLNVSQPAISVAISAVETRLGQQVFHRAKGARATLTPFGRAYVAEVDALLSHAEALEDPRRQSARQMARLVIGCFDDLAPQLLAPVLHHLRTALPGLDIRVRAADFATLATGVATGEIDLALTYDLGLDAGVDRITLFEKHPYAFLAQDDPLADLAHVTLADIAARPLVLFEEGVSIRHMLHLFAALGLRPHVAHRVRSLELMRSLAANGEGVGISYTCPPGDQSYDGKRLHSRAIMDQSAAEKVILAVPAGLGLAPRAEIIATIRAMDWAKIIPPNTTASGGTE